MRTLHLKEGYINLWIVFAHSSFQRFKPLLHALHGYAVHVTCIYLWMFHLPHHLKSSGPSLSHAVVSMVDDISEPRVCASCSFTNDSTARGCTVELQNDEFTFVFNMSRESSEELTLLECFPVPEAGVFSVSVYELDHDGMVGHKVWRLPEVTTWPDVNAATHFVKNGITTHCAYCLCLY